MPGGIGMLNPLLPQDDASGREIRSLNKLGKVINRSLKIINEIREGITDLSQIMRGDIGSHPHCNPSAAINQ